MLLTIARGSPESIRVRENAGPGSRPFTARGFLRAALRPIVTAMQIELVLVDFDDTLVATASRFSDARRRLFALLAEQGLDLEHVERLYHEEVDPELRERYGFGPHRLAECFAETYIRACVRAGATVSHEVRARCGALGREVIGAPSPIVGAVDALSRLADAHPTVVYTQSARTEYQIECVRQAGVLEIVGHERVHVCEEKTTAAFRATIERYGVRDPRGTWMIGNSIRSDVNPALEAGANAILVEVAEPWAFDVVEPVSPGFARVGSFAEAVSVLVSA